MSAGSGRSHPVFQLLFPFACVGSALLSNSDHAISSPQNSKRKVYEEMAQSFCVPTQPSDARSGGNPAVKWKETDGDVSRLGMRVAAVRSGHSRICQTRCC